VTHLTDGEIEGFVSDGLTQDAKRQAVAHLLTGCWSCRTRARRYGELLFQCDRGQNLLSSVGIGPRQADYGASLARAWANAQARLYAFRDKEAELEALWSQGFEARYRDPELMLELAVEARAAVQELSPRQLGAGVVADLQARAWGEYGNALRVNASLKRAERALRQARVFAEEGTGDPLLLGRLTDFLASLRTDQRRLGEALELLKEVRQKYCELGESHLAGRAGISMGTLTYYVSDLESSVALIRDGLALLEPGRDPVLEAVGEKNLIAFLSEAGRYHEAAARLLRSGLRRRLMAEPLALAKIRWIEGQIAAGLKRLDRSALILDCVRQDFVQLGKRFESALVSLDLTSVLLRQGRLLEARSLAVEAFETLSELGVGAEAAKALAYLRESCGCQEPPLSAITSVREFFARLEYHPELVFKPA